MLVVDEAQKMRPPLFELLRQLLNFETSNAKLLQIVLFGQNELATKIDRISKNKRIGQLAAIRKAQALSDEQSPTPCSSQTGEGVKEIWKAIDAFLRGKAELAN